jgi:segregation and condensation protein B
VLSRDVVEPRKLSRAAMETLAIIAYHQPVTRAEIEEIRGVATSKGTLDLLLETGWIRLRGRRKAPGRPVTYGTTRPSSAISASTPSRICPGSRS